MSDVVTGIKQLPVKPTVRIVMSKDRTPQSYIALFKAIHSVADIMAQPVDSFDLQSYSVDQYRQRFETSYQYLSQYTSIWEIGNEINSDWIREDPNQITEKIAAAYRLIKNKHGIAALTPYYFPPNEGTLPMEDWLKKYIPDDMKQDLDYVLVSYYEDDNDGYQPHWKQIFTRLETLFPHAKLGIGECGNTSDNATPVSKSAMFRRYYSMPRYTSRYIGGYFWWYWVQDSITYKNNTLWQETANSMRR
ncbi:MAG: hypothetical protein Q4A82_06615 [Corynebacterium sp.]|nr:hypothetical protein [Corynebacterium sp.]